MKSTLDAETVRAEDLRPGDLVLRVGLTGPAWCEVTAVATYPVPEFPGEVVCVEFAGADARRYVAGSTFARRIETADAR
ncbi:hypothetical protein [Pseudonocardia sp.]|uniref:hypothetical protein n=1 Tax=Pseudonocardia sp. TaxID=60912 RepID=UPI00261ED8F8|nr:hypothetical protein [Pseudonocardia sp.]